MAPSCQPKPLLRWHEVRQVGAAAFGVGLGLSETLEGRIHEEALLIAAARSLVIAGSVVCAPRNVLTPYMMPSDGRWPVPSCRTAGGWGAEPDPL